MLVDRVCKLRAQPRENLSRRNFKRAQCVSPVAG